MASSSMRRKRARVGEEVDREAQWPARRRGQQQQLNQKQKQKGEGIGVGEGEGSEMVTMVDEVELFKRVFDFPWKEGCDHLREDGGEFRDVFFSSLVDGSSAKIGLPGDRLARARPPFDLAVDTPCSWPSSESSFADEDDPDGHDCFWGALLQPPPPTTLMAAKGPTA